MKRFIVLLMVASMCASTEAQQAIVNTKLLDNIFVSFRGGLSSPLDFNKPFPLNSSASISLGKWFTPIYGQELEGTMWLSSKKHPFFTGSSNNAIHATYIGMNNLINLTNLFTGYAGKPSLFELNAVAGVGWIHTYSPNRSNSNDNYLGVTTGLDFNFNLGKAKIHSINVRPTVFWNLSKPGTKAGNLAFNKQGALISINIGYTYHFMNSYGSHHFLVYDVGAMIKEINRLHSR